MIPNEGNSPPGGVPEKPKKLPPLQGPLPPRTRVPAPQNLGDFAPSAEDSDKEIALKIRSWYNAQEQKIPALNEQWTGEGVPVEQRARRAQEIRHDARLGARELDPDEGRVHEQRRRDFGMYNNPDGPTFDFLVDKNRNKGLAGDDVYEAIIDSSTRTNADVNKSAGLSADGKSVSTGSDGGDKSAKPPAGPTAPSGKLPGAGPGTPHRDQMKKPSRLGGLADKLKAAPSAAANKFKGVPGRAGQAAGGATALMGGAAGAAGMLPELAAVAGNPAAFAQEMLGEAPALAEGLLGGIGGGQMGSPGQQGDPAQGKNPQQAAGAKPSVAGAKPAAGAAVATDAAKSTDAMKKSADAAKASTDAMKKSTEAVKGSSDGFKKFSSELTKSAGAQKSSASATKNMASSQKGLNSAMRQNPLGMVITAITTAIGVITLLVQNWDKVKIAFDWVYKNVLTPVGKWFSDIWSGTVVPAFKASVESVGGFFRGMGDTVSGVWNGIIGTIKSVIGTIGNILSKVPDIGPGSMLRGFGETLKKFAEPDKKADGGLLSGPGGPRDDVIPVLASNGEYVVNAASTAKNLPLLEHINSGAVPKFADGGIVHSSWSDLLGEQAQNAASQFLFGPKGKPADDDKTQSPNDKAISKAFTGFAGAAGNFVSGMLGDALGVFGADRVPYLFQGIAQANNAIAEKRKADAKPAEGAPESGEPTDDSAVKEQEAPNQPGGLPEKAVQLIDFAKGVNGKPYDRGGVNWGDCSGAVSALANFMAGWSPFGSRFTTANEGDALAKRGAIRGKGPDGSLNIGWFDRGNEDGHTAATLPNGVNFEMGGRGGNGQYGGMATGANDTSFDHHMHFPPARFLAAGGAVTGPGSSIGDMVPAWLSDGEFVVNARSAEANRSLLHAINQDANTLSNLGQSMLMPTRALPGTTGGDNINQATTIEMVTPDVDTAFQKFKTWENQRSLTYIGRWS